jgi:hypothetical protein
MPHSWHESNQKLVTYDAASFSNDYGISSIRRLENGLYIFDYQRAAKRSDFRWIERPTGIAHISGRRFFCGVVYGDDDDPICIEHELFFEIRFDLDIGANRVPQEQLFFSKCTLEPLFSFRRLVPTKKHHIERTAFGSLNIFDSDSWDLRQTPSCYEHYVLKDGKSDIYFRQNEIELALHYESVANLLLKNAGYLIGNDSILGIISGVFGGENCLWKLKYIIDREISRRDSGRTFYSGIATVIEDHLRSFW